MKLFKYAPLCLTALALGACSNDDNIDGTNGNNNEGTTSYVAIKINSVGNSPSAAPHRIRAEYTETEGGGIYEDGTTAESAINKVRFYFFNADGTPYRLKVSEGVSAKNYIDKTVSIDANGTNHGQTVEEKTDAVLVIEGVKNTQPTSVVAIINPETLTSSSASVLKDEMHLSELTSATCTDGKFHNTDATGSPKDFVMSNSVYLDGGVVKNATSCVGYVQNTSVDAKANPVDIYVERVDAKVTTSVSSTSTEFTGNKTKVGTLSYYKASTTPGDLPTLTTVDVYATIQGWGLADENGKSTVSKQIDASWNSADLGIDTWSTSDYHRSFWATSVPIDDGTNPVVNHSFASYATELGKSLYTLENTPTSTSVFTTDNNLTKVLVAAKLTYDDGAGEKNAEICSYRGNTYITKEAALSAIASNYAQYFTRSTDATTGGYVYTSLIGDNIEFTLDGLTEAGGKDYQVVCKLKTSVTVYKQTSTGGYEDATTELTNKLKKELAECRTEGNTYYYTAIQHLATNVGKLGYYGVVRNHSYKIDINKISGFGTPVFDVNRVIDPVVPADADTYLAAKINVLSWRVVSSSVDLGK